MKDPEAELPAQPAANRIADRAFVGCLYVAAGLAIAMFFYVGFFVFTILDDRNEWGLLEPYLTESTNEILYVIYWPLIVLYLWLVLP